MAVKRIVHEDQSQREAPPGVMCLQVTVKHLRAVLEGFCA